MSVARPARGLLSATATLALVDLLAGRAGGAPIEELIRDLAASTSISWSRARSTVVKLIGYEVLVTAGTSIIAVSAAARSDCHRLIADRVADELTALLSSTRSWSCVRLDASTGALLLDSMAMPSMPDGLGMWVTDFGVASRPAIRSRFWILAEDRQDTFLKTIREENASRPRRPKTMEDLAAQMALDAEHGEAAERWVLQFEQLRLRGHPLRDQIRRVSLNDVSAGYDILSFASPTSLQHDLFIEVKSHGEIKLFHWSRNEIATAREFGEDYALYLVDRTRCGEQGYSPQIITAPTPEMFAAPDSGWMVDATSFEHIAVAG